MLELWNSEDAGAKGREHCFVVGITQDTDSDAATEFQFSSVREFLKPGAKLRVADIDVAEGKFIVGMIHAEVFVAVLSACLGQGKWMSVALIVGLADNEIGSRARFANRDEDTLVLKNHGADGVAQLGGELSKR